MTPSLEQGTWDLRSSAGYKDALPQASGGAPLNACLQRGQRESWAIKDRVGCGGHMHNPQPSWAEQWLSLQTEGVVPWTWCFPFCPVPLSSSSSNFCSHDSGWVRQLISGSYILEHPDSFPRGWAYFQTWWHFRGALYMPQVPAWQSHSLLHSPIRTLSNFCTLELTPTIR